jgi:hypothetical protein
MGLVYSRTLFLYCPQWKVKKLAVISFFKYLFFYRQAKTQHGVHSPFVFALVCSCFFCAEWKKQRFFPWNKERFKTLDLLFKKRLQNYFAAAAFEEVAFELHFIEDLSKTPKQTINSKSVWVFSGINTTREQWQKINFEESVRLDFFFWGVLFFKADQAKETFLLRIF